MIFFCKENTNENMIKILKTVKLLAKSHEKRKKTQNKIYECFMAEIIRIHRIQIIWCHILSSILFQ